MAKADLSDMPVMIPGSAIGRMTSSDTVSRPKKRARVIAAAQSVPSTSAIPDAIAATLSEQSGGQISCRFQATANHFSVRSEAGTDSCGLRS